MMKFPSKENEINPNREKLVNELLDGLVIREHQLHYPEMSVDMYDKAEIRFKTDPMFRSKVEQLVAGIMNLVDKYAEFREDLR